MSRTDEIRARREAILGGRWDIVKKGNALAIVSRSGIFWRGVCYGLRKDGNEAAFFAQAPADIDYLLQENAQLSQALSYQTEEIQRARAELETEAVKAKRRELLAKGMTGPTPRLRRILDMPLVGLGTIKHHIRLGGCVARNMGTGTIALIDADNVVVGRIRPAAFDAMFFEGLTDGCTEFGCIQAYALGDVKHDPNESKIPERG